MYNQAQVIAEQSEQLMVQTILVVDDDKEIARTMSDYLVQAGYQTRIAHNGTEALHIARAEAIDLMVLDLMLPDQDGWDVTRTVRADRRMANLPIIMLTARVGDTDKIIGLELGADDYITKPFNPREVIARVRSVLRRTKPTQPDTVLRVDDLELDTLSRNVTLKGESVSLTPTEYAILQTLMANPNYVFSRAELIAKSLGYEYESIERTLDSHIRNLRKKIEPDTQNPRYIQTIYGVGYKLEA